MAPRQRNISASTVTPAVSEDEDSSSVDDGSDISLVHEEKSRPTIRAKKTSANTRAPPKTLHITEADVARDNHDYFNILALPVVVIAISMNHDFPSFHYTGNHFWTMWGATLMYFFLDLSWVALVPTCVKSPGVIVKHHIVAMIYLTGPIYYPEMGAILSVEVNTWFLICRRLVYRSNYCPSGYAVVSPIITTIVSTLFYVTWIAIRCYIYPHLLVLFLTMWKEEIDETGIVFHWACLFIPVHAALCVLNLKWTYDLFRPIIKRWLGTGPKTVAVQNGL
eukprot:CAMPEP_0168245514 /NCGR_PEP_ID=MMETSP0140_2-20121125/25205_1 /TAXON_ID=44445 /ORGANISM="Pseudo-nitzschia australis, Strain 10249 10 AB" /LENGTH=278 /DNA_ID=CAMNT_0008181109 /DNA_START=112 /DNA_END=948 /DNA_ORIENTATION=+